MRLASGGHCIGLLVLALLASGCSGRDTLSAQDALRLIGEHEDAYRVSLAGIPIAVSVETSDERTDHRAQALKQPCFSALLEKGLAINLRQTGTREEFGRDTWTVDLAPHVRPLVLRKFQGQYESRHSQPPSGDGDATASVIDSVGRRPTKVVRLEKTQGSPRKAEVEFLWVFKGTAFHGLCSDWRIGPHKGTALFGRTDDGWTLERVKFIHSYPPGWEPH